MRTICIIPARGGSVRIPRKNIKLFHGRPIIEYSIETAKRSRLFDDIVVSTDDYEITRVALDAGAAIFERTKDDGTRGTQEVAAEVLREWRPPASIACVLYATAPLIDVRLLRVGYQSLLSIPHPFAYSVNDLGEDIGGYYWGFAHAFLAGEPLGEGFGVWTPANQCCDINTEADWLRAEEMYGRLHGNT